MSTYDINALHAFSELLKYMIGEPNITNFTNTLNKYYSNGMLNRILRIKFCHQCMMFAIKKNNAYEYMGIVLQYGFQDNVR